MDMNDKSSVECFASFMLAAAKSDIEQEGGLAPVAVLCGADSDDLFPIQANLPLNEESKEAWVAQIHAFIKSMDPVLVFTACEAWMISVPTENKERLNKILEETGGRLEGCEERQEIVEATLEHKTLGSFVWQSNIIRGDDGKVRLTPFRFRQVSETQGRFSNLLSKSALDDKAQK